MQIEQLCVDFATRRGNIRVLKHINLHLNPGEVLGIVGESGCGKSMTALAVMRLVPSPPGRIASGGIRLRGRNLVELSERQMRDIRGNEIAMIFQEPMTSLNPVFRVGTQIAENIQRHQGVSKSTARRQALEMMRAVRIPAARRRIRQYPHELSGGMRQRVMIAMALSCEPSILIADEPTTALDVTVQAQIFDLLQDIQQNRGTSIILITHDMGVIAEVAQRVAVMYAGHKVEEGPVGRIIRHPRHPYTRGLLQCAPFVKTNPGPVRRPLAEIPGFVPHLSLLDGKCPFRPRCSQVQPQCHEQMPAEVQVGEGHYATCWAAGGS